MYLNEQLLNRLAQDRTQQLDREARRLSQQRELTGGWRLRAAHSLKALAEWLEPGAPASEWLEPSAPAGSHSNLIRH